MGGGRVTRIGVHKDSNVKKKNKAITVNQLWKSGEDDHMLGWSLHLNTQPMAQKFSKTKHKVIPLN